MRQDGFTLIELLIAMVIVVILSLLAMPVYTEFMANTRARNVTEGLANGVRLAQLEAVKRNEPVRFMLTTGGWEVRDVGTHSLLKTEAVVEATSSGAPTIATEPAGTTEITFSGLGRALKRNPPVPPAVADTAPIDKIKVQPTSAGTRPLGVAISAAGSSIKVCDPDSRFTKAGSSDPLACPYPW